MKKNIFWSILILIAVLIIGIGAYLWVKNSGQISPAPVPNSLGVAFDRGDFAQVIALANDILKTEPNNINALLFLSQTYAQKGSLEFKEKEFGQKAVDYANQVLILAPNNAKAYIALGYANEIMQNYPVAITAYTKAISLDGQNVDAYVHRGHAYDLSGDITRARADYLKAAVLDSKNIKVAENLGRIYAREGNLTQAKMEFLLVANNTNNVRLKTEAYYNLSSIAFVATSTGALAESLAYASTSVAIDPTYPSAYLGLGRAYVQMNNFSKASIALAQAIKLYPNFAGAYEWQASMYAKQAKNTEAIAAYEMEKKVALVDIGLMESERPSIIAHASFNEAILYAKMKQKDLAVKALTESITVADPMTLLVTQFSLQKASTNDFKILVGYQPFTDLVKALDKKVQDTLLKLQTKPTSWLKKIENVLVALLPQKASASVVGCGSFQGGQITMNDNGAGGYDTTLAQYFCDVLIQHLNNDDTNLHQAELVAQAIDPSAQGGLFGTISTSLFLGCANGVGATYVPVAPSPLSPKGTLSCGLTSTTLNWANAIPGATAYNLRVDDTTANGWNGLCNGVNPGDLCENNKTVTSESYPVIPGHQYNFWVDDGSGRGISTSTSFNVPVCTSLSASCSASPTNIGIGSSTTWTANASGGSGHYNYIWSGSVGGTITNTTATSVSTSTSSYTASTTPYTAAIKVVDYNQTSASTTVACSNNVTVSSSATPLTSSCSVSPNPAVVNQTVTWSATGVSGGTGPYTYLWSGANINGATTSSATTSYSTTGTYNGSVKVTDSLHASTTISCPTVVGGGGGGGSGVSVGSVQNGSCGSATGLTFTSAPTTNLCSYSSTTTTNMISNGSPVTSWTWYCYGLNYGHTDATCNANSSTVVIPPTTYPATSTLPCVVTSPSTANIHNEVTIGENTQWNISTPPSTTDYNWHWLITEGDATTTIDQNSTPLNKIFTTVGLKTVAVSFTSSSSTIPTVWSCVNGTSATTTVVQAGGNNNEI